MIIRFSLLELSNEVTDLRLLSRLQQYRDIPITVQADEEMVVLRRLILLKTIQVCVISSSKRFLPALLFGNPVIYSCRFDRLTLSNGFLNPDGVIILA